jgi:hypothetical protein
MHVVSTGPLPVASLLWQARPAVWVLTVVSKATFTLAPGAARLAAAQEPIREEDAHHDDDEALSLLEASDLVPLKPGADVVLVGHAFAPGGAPVASLVARLVVGTVDKSLHLEGPPFTRMPLRYERSPGGFDTDNPVGVAGDDAPNVRLAGALEGFAGFGPIAPSWPLRRDRLGRHAAAWSLGALRQDPLPEDIDRAFFHVAPLDQRLADLRGDESILLENLHPEHPRLATALPGLRPLASVTQGAAPRELVMRCDTLVIDSDRGLCTTTWRAQVPLARPDEPGEVRVGLPGSTAAAPRGPVVADTTMPIDLSAPLFEIKLERPPAIPFGGKRASAPPSSSPPASSAFAGSTLEVDATAKLHEIPLTPFQGRPRSAPPSTPVPPSVPPIPQAPPPVVPKAAAPAASPWAAVAATTRVAGRALGDVPQSSRAPAPPVVAVAPPREALALVWLDRKSMPRIVRKPAWQAILDAIEEEPVDFDAGDPAFADDPAEVEDRAQAFDILQRAEASTADGVRDAAARSAEGRGKIVPPLELVAGELELAFDELETLNALVAHVSPLEAEGDLAAAVAAAEKFLARPGAATAPAIAASLSARIREALGKLQRGATLAAVDGQVARALVEQRHYQRKKVLGGPHLRGLLHEPGAEHPLVVYLPAALADELPLASRFRVRLLAAVHLAVDENEREPVALAAVAVARVVSMSR